MSVKTSISLTEQQDAFARKMVETGRFTSKSAVVQRGLDLVREELDRDEEDTDSMRELLLRRLEGPFVLQEEFGRMIEEMLAEKRRDLGLEA